MNRLARNYSTVGLYAGRGAITVWEGISGRRRSGPLPERAPVLD
jgi:hypothetical protein